MSDDEIVEHVVVSTIRPIHIPLNANLIHDSTTRAGPFAGQYTDPSADGTSAFGTLPSHPRRSYHFCLSPRPHRTTSKVHSHSTHGLTPVLLRTIIPQSDLAGQALSLTMRQARATVAKLVSTATRLHLLLLLLEDCRRPSPSQHP